MLAVICVFMTGGGVWARGQSRGPLPHAGEHAMLDGYSNAGGECEGCREVDPSVFGAPVEGL